MFRGVKIHRSAKTSICKNPRLEAELQEKMKVEPENPEVVMRLLTHLQCDGPPRGRIAEALNLCLRRRTDWRWSADWQTAVLECCTNYQVRKVRDSPGFVPVYGPRINFHSCNVYFLILLCLYFTPMSEVIIVVTAQDQFKSGRQCGPELYSLQLASLDRLVKIKTRQGELADISQLTVLLLRMERSLALLQSSQASAGLLSHWRGQLLR